MQRGLGWHRAPSVGVQPPLRRLRTTLAIGRLLAGEGAFGQKTAAQPSQESLLGKFRLQQTVVTVIPLVHHIDSVLVRIQKNVEAMAQ